MLSLLMAMVDIFSWREDGLTNAQRKEITIVIGVSESQLRVRCHRWGNLLFDVNGNE